MAGALIVIAEIAQRDFSWIEGLRRAHYPPERNHVSAHLTMFHAIAPSAQSELCARVSKIVRRAPPRAEIVGMMDLGGGVAFRIVSPDLDGIRSELAHDLHGLLGAQDAGGWRPHVTIQNKVAPTIARMLKESLERGFVRRSLSISGLGVYRYLGGPWEKVAVYPFR